MSRLGSLSPYSLKSARQESRQYPIEVYTGNDYKFVFDIEKHVEQSVLWRIIETGRFCLPDFVKRGVDIWFAFTTSTS